MEGRMLPENYRFADDRFQKNQPEKWGLCMKDPSSEITGFTASVFRAFQFNSALNLFGLLFLKIRTPIVVCVRV